MKQRIYKASFSCLASLLICASTALTTCAAFKEAVADAVDAGGETGESQGGNAVRDWLPASAEAYPAHRFDYSADATRKYAGSTPWDDGSGAHGSPTAGPKALRPAIRDVAYNRTQRQGYLQKEWVALAGYYPSLRDPAPRTSDGLLHKEEVRDGGRCLDGSRPVYYYAYGPDPTKWLIEFEGGDWCTRFTSGRDDEEEEKDQRRNCFERRNFKGLQGGTTIEDPETLSLDYLGEQASYMSSSSSRNPVMWSWNKVYVRNCDGSSFTSSRKDPWGGVANDSDDEADDNRIFMQGKFILQSIFEDLVQTKHLGHAEEVVIAGCSAGGLSVMLHADRIAEWIRAAAVVKGRINTEAIQVRAYADSGFFLDESCGDGDQDYNARMRFLYDNHQARDGLNPKCVEHYAPTGEEYKCLFAENALRFLDTPVFLAQSMLDGWSLVWVGCEDRDEFKEKMKQRLAEAVAIPRNGGFVDACQHHCHCHEAIKIGGARQIDAFKTWYEGDSSRIWFSEECDVKFTYPECPSKDG